MKPLLALLLVPALLSAGRAPDPGMIDRLIGAWEGEGELFGRPATFSMTWSRPLGEPFARLEFENRLIQADGTATPVLSAIAFYRAAGGDRLEGTWYDSRGEVLELRAVATDSTLVTDWTAAGERGRTTYRLTGPDRVEVRDEVRQGEAWRAFGRATYRRSGPPGT